MGIGLILTHSCLVFQKYLELEDATDQSAREQGEKMESLESIVRMLELKAKNAVDHGET